MTARARWERERSSDSCVRACRSWAEYCRSEARPSGQVGRQELMVAEGEMDGSLLRETNRRAGGLGSAPAVKPSLSLHMRCAHGLQPGGRPIDRACHVGRLFARCGLRGLSHVCAIIPYRSHLVRLSTLRSKLPQTRHTSDTKLGKILQIWSLASRANNSHRGHHQQRLIDSPDPHPPSLSISPSQTSLAKVSLSHNGLLLAILLSLQHSAVECYPSSRLKVGSDEQIQQKAKSYSLHIKMNLVPSAGVASTNNNR